MKTIIKFLFTLLILFAFSCSQETTQDPLPTDLEGVSAKASSKQTAPIGGLDGITGTSTLHRNKNGITVNFKAENLYPGAYTIWWVIWNYPQECAFPGECDEPDFKTPVIVGVDLLYAGGHVVGNNGKANISGHLNAGDASGSIFSDMGVKVGNTFSSEVHVVLRTHGPKVPGVVNEQISSYGGGCNPDIVYDPFSVYPNAIGECADIAAAIFAPVD